MALRKHASASCLPALCSLLPAFLRQQEFSLDPIHLRLVEPLVILVHHRQRLGEYGQPLLYLPRFPIRSGQQDKKIGVKYPCPYGLAGGQPLADLGNSLFNLSLVGSCPSLQDSPLS